MWAAVLFTCVTVGSAAFYLEASEPIEIQAERIEIPVEPTVEPRSSREEAPRIETKTVSRPPPSKPRPKPVIREEPKPKPPARDAAVLSMLADLDSEDPTVIARVARKLETEAGRLNEKDAQLSIRRCASMSALRAERRELARCLEQFEVLLGTSK